jgi:hypothetical protein
MAEYAITSLPQLLMLSDTKTLDFPCDLAEQRFLTQTRRLLDNGFYDHALLDLWNACVHNLRRRIEAYGVDLFLSVIKDEPGRKKYDPNGDSLPERWSGVEDLVMISGASRLGLLSKKAGKILETINWMRNHASAAHATEDRVEMADVAAFAIVLQKNLFEIPLPDPGHSVASIFDPVKQTYLAEPELDLLRDQIRSLRPQDLRTCFGFLLDLLAKGVNPGVDNARALMAEAWQHAPDDLRKVAGSRFHALTVAPQTDDSADKGARLRFLEQLVARGGIKYIPDAVRAQLFRDAARRLAKAKDAGYGWADEAVAAEALAELGTSVPAIAFEEVYQEILAVWCGNHWGRSGAHSSLEPFISCLNTTQLIRVTGMFESNPRARSELGQIKPKRQAKALLTKIEAKLTLAQHTAEVQRVMHVVDSF